MTLCDTGPLVALVDRGDPHHQRCRAVLESLPPIPLQTTWPCWVEAIYLVGRIGGFASQEVLWTYVADGLVQLLRPEIEEWRRHRSLMQKYQDIPMDLADASLVAAAERVNQRRIFSLDKHFYAYRINGVESFEVIPG